MGTKTHVYHLGAVKPWVQNAADELGNLFDFSNIGGWRAFGSVPKSDHPKGLALDFMTFNRTKGDALVAFAVANADRLGITYIIYQRQIWQHGKWEPYHGPNPHIDHVHISFSDTGGNANAPIGGTTNVSNPLDPSSWPVVKQVEGLAARLEDPLFWKRLGYYFLGMALIGMGVFFLLRKPAEQAAITVAKVV